MIRITTYLLLLLMCCPLMAQDMLQKADGSTIPISAETVKIDPREKEVSYISNGKTVTVGFKQLDRISFGGKVFKIFTIGKKSRGYYVLAESGGRTLAAVSTKRTSSVGGFNVPYTLHDVAVIENGKILQEISFTENNDRKNIKKRQEAKGMIGDHFGSCVEVLERLAFFSNNETNLIEGDIVGLLVPAVYVRCQ